VNFTVRNTASGQLAIVASMDGHDAPEWVVVPATPPTDAGAYILIGTTFVPVVEPITPLAYFQLFTAAEQVALYATTDAQIRVGIGALGVVPSVNMADATVIGGIDRMVTLGLVTAARATRIKAGLPPLQGA
jgi:hypothetical protein